MKIKIFRDLGPEEEKEFREWARTNFNPDGDKINPVWHPVVVNECEKMIEEKT